MGQKTYPVAVSRTLDPTNKSIVTIVGLHDHQLTDADINLIQDNQDLKRTRLVNDTQCTSGCLTYMPMQFNTSISNSFTIPAFDVLFNGEVVTVAGTNSTDVTLNNVVLPQPQFWTVGLNAPDCYIYVVFLELWYQLLNPITGQGYFQDPITNLRYFYPYGGVNPSTSPNGNNPNNVPNAELLPDDSIDPYQGLFTTERAQIQWRLNVQSIAPSYNFTQYRFGLDPGTLVTQAVYAQAGLPSTSPGVSPLFGVTTYQFTNMGAITGDTGLWRAGDGNVNNSLGTMDGYSYAMPIAVVFQRNTGNFDIVNNLFGCASSSFPVGVNGGINGLLSSGVSGRFDSKLADQVFPDDVVDTRLTVKLDGWDYDRIMRESFADIVMGNSRQAIGRGESPGNKPEALGSTLAYNVSMSTTPIPNTNTVGSWDGYANGFSSDQRVFFSTIAVTTSQKSVGAPGNWVQGDQFTISLPNSSTAVISALNVTALVSNQINGTKAPAALLQGQVSINGLGTKAVSVTISANLVNTAFDPGPNPIYVTFGVQYPAGSGIDLHHVPFAVDGGIVFDSTSGLQVAAFGISEYDVQASQVALPPSNSALVTAGVGVNAEWAISPEYSDTILGTRIWLQIPGSQGVQQTVGGNTTTTFIIPRNGISGNLNGLYGVRAWDSVTNAFYPITGRAITQPTVSAPLGNFILSIQGIVPPSSTMILSMMAQNTCQFAYNAPVKGITTIEETVLFGNYTANSTLPMDSRVSVVSIGFDAVNNVTNVVLAAQQPDLTQLNGGCTIKGVAGDDLNRLIWVLDPVSGNLTAVQVNSLSFANGIITVVVPGTVTLTGTNAQPFFFVGSILPAFASASTMTVEIEYVPYQGEGVLNRDYEIIHWEDNVLLTTNGTGAAPVIGLSDVYPYNRELPIITQLPAQLAWNDAGLNNEALATFFDSNYVAMRQNDVETVFLAPMHTNDFIQPVNRDIRKIVQFLTTGQRGFATAIPHIGFAIAPPTPRTVLGQNLQSTIAPIILYVDNQNGNDDQSGLSPAEALKNIPAALALLPPVLRHPCSIQLINTGLSFNLNLLQNNLDTVALGDGQIVTSKVYCLGNASRVIQDEGRLVITTAPGTTGNVLIDATGFAGFGDGPTVAFFCDTTRVIFNNINFQGFTSPTIMGINSDIEYVNCNWINNVQAGAYQQGCGVVLDGGQITLPTGGVGHVGVQSEITASGVILAVSPAGAAPGPFFVAERQSAINLQTHAPTTTQEINITGTMVIAEAELNSSIVVTADFQTAGSCVLQANSVLARTVSVSPFLGTLGTNGVQADVSSSIVTQLS
jgi:hypothetical protein